MATGAAAPALALAAPGAYAASALGIRGGRLLLGAALTLAGADRVQTVTVAIAFFPGIEEFPWGEIAAASVIVTVPVAVVVLLLQRRIVSGLAVGAPGG